MGLFGHRRGWCRMGWSGGYASQMGGAGMEPVRDEQDRMKHLGVRSGKVVFQGTRLQAATVLHYLARAGSLKRVLERWPSLKREAVKEAVRLAGTALLEKHAAQVE